MLAQRPLKQRMISTSKDMSSVSEKDLALGQLIVQNRNLRLSETRNTTLSKIYRVVLIMLGIAVVLLFIMGPFPYVCAPYWISTTAVNTEFWGYVAKNVDAARAFSPDLTSTFPYKGYEVAMSLAGWFPGLYRSWFFGSGDEAMIPNILYFSSISPMIAPNVGINGTTMAKLTATPAYFSQMLGNLKSAFETATPKPGQSREMAILCRAWESVTSIPSSKPGESTTVNIDFTTCDVEPKSKGSSCNAGSVASAGVSGAIGGAMIGGMIAPPIGFLIGALFCGGLSAGASAWSQKCKVF